MKSIQQLLNMTGKVAVLTGGAGYLGQTFSDALTELGASVILVDVDEAGLQRTAQDLNDKWNVSVKTLVCDFESESDRNELIAELNQQENIDVLVNNAAFVGDSNLEGWAEPLSRQSLDTWSRAIEVNLTSVFHLSQGLAGKLSENKGGSIVNISSIYGIVAPDLSLYDGTSMGSPAAYAASKGGMVQFSRWLSTVLAPKVRVNCISPGGIKRRQPEIFQERYIAKTPLGRMGVEEDIKGALVYLVSGLSSYVTGQNIVVDGGWTSW